MTVAVEDEAPTARVPGQEQGAGVRVSRPALAATLAVAAILPPVAGWSGMPLAGSILCLSMALAVALAPKPTFGRLSALGWLPFAFLLLMSAVAGVGVFAGFAHVGFWSGRPGALLLWLSVAAVVVAVAIRRGGRVEMVSGDAESAAAGGAMFVGGLVLSLVQPFEVWSRNVSLGTDFARHLVITKDVAESGALTYSAGGLYPKGLHALYATLWQGSGTSGFESTWLGLQALTWVMLCLMAMALVNCTTRACRALSLPPWLGWVTSGLALLAFVQSMWLSAMMARGFVTSVLAGLIVAVAVTLPFDGPWLGSARAVTATAVLVVAAANAWQVVALLPAVLCLLALAAWWRKRTAGLATVVVLLLCAAAAASPGLAILGNVTDSSVGYAEQLARPAGSGLWLPEPWWWLGCVLTIATVVMLWRGGWRGVAASWTVLLLAATAAVFALAWGTRTDWSDPGYYELKTLWTMSNLVLPGALAGAATLLWRSATWGAQRGPGIIRVATIVGVAAAVLASGAVALGRMTATSDVGNAIRGGYGNIPFHLIALRHLEDVRASFPGGTAATFGIVPSARNDVVAIGSAGANDQLVQEGLRWIDRGVAGPPYTSLIRRDAPAVCEYLRANPEAVLVTGPNPAAGVHWLLQSGCPRSVVMDRTIHEVTIGDKWFAGIPDAGRPFSYPSWDEFRAKWVQAQGEG